MLIGTSGWQYKDWRGRFYPPGVPQPEWLAFYAREFPVVEVNSTFYRLPQRSAAERWRGQTPEGFLMAAKMSRYLTHIKRLREPQEPIARFFGRLEPLGDRLGPVLIQLPPTMRVDIAALACVLRALPAGIQIAVEPRHPSWWIDGVRRTLEHHNATLCWADRKGRRVGPLWRTADWGYLRLHEGRAAPRPRYGPRALRSWRDRMAGVEQMFVFFNNDPGGAAIEDARALRKLNDR